MFFVLFFYKCSIRLLLTMHLMHWAKLNLKCGKVFFERFICNFLFQMMSVPWIFSIHNGIHKTLKVIIEKFKVWRPYSESLPLHPIVEEAVIKERQLNFNHFIALILINIYIEMYCWITAVLTVSWLKLQNSVFFCIN